jgi:glutathione peroxidase
MIRAWAKKRHGVEFPIFDKIEVNGPNTHPIYLFLRQKSPLSNRKRPLENPAIPVPKETSPIPWNFSKFLVDSNGVVVDFYGPKIEPNEIHSAIEKLLNAQPSYLPTEKEQISNKTTQIKGEL